jgi:plastocyanin
MKFLNNLSLKSPLKWVLMTSLVTGSMCLAVMALANPSSFHIQIEGWSPYYSPKIATVRSGETIIWKNPTATHHSIRHDGCLKVGTCAFDSGAIAPNQTFEIPSLPPGAYAYHCTIHPIMRGVLYVQPQGQPSNI